ncbi:MAG: hypothetical protein DRP91_08255 [Candidatus Neomarinimicrobiota bacterium]|nr:MAG: hypothetical protein DRP91_08255 [Candidatus Neomarinimicrobiota bacterium]
MISRVIYSIALSVAILTFILCMISNISLFTSIVRSLVVFVGVLFSFFVASSILSLSLRAQGKVTDERKEEADKEKRKKVNAE